MLYIGILTSKAHGNTCVRFDDFTALQNWADENADRFTAEVRPAHYDEIEAQASSLRDQIKDAEFQYENSPWDMGPRYRADIQRLQGELTKVTPYLSAEVAA